MDSMKNHNLTKSVIKWSLLITVIFYGATGFGITEFRTVEALTLGLLNKAWAFKIHNILEIPFIILLGSHILFVPISKLWRKT